MKNIVPVAFFPGWAIAFLLGFFVSSPLSAQTDVSKTIKSLPRKDGTYLLVVLDSVYFYAVKKQGKIARYEVTDANGEPVPDAGAAQPQTAAKASAPVGGGAGSGITDPAKCVSPPGEICRWSKFSQSCVCISTVLK